MNLKRYIFGKEIRPVPSALLTIYIEEVCEPLNDEGLAKVIDDHNYTQEESDLLGAVAYI